MIKNIVFDFGGVLVQYDFIHFFTSLLGSREKAEWFLTHVFTFEINAEMDKGIHEPRYYIEQQKNIWPKYQRELEAFHTQYTEIFTGETAGMRHLMHRLKAKGYRLLGLSNWSSRVYDVMEVYDIFGELEDYLLSKDVHQLKPEADIYHSFLKKFGVKAEECVFIDDKEENIEGARAVGMYGIVFRDTPQLIRELKPLLLPYTCLPATAQDDEAIWQIVHGAAVEMVRQGRNQWNHGYPPYNLIRQDLQQGVGYVLRLNGKIVGYMAVTLDGEPAYDTIEGAWLTNGPYATVHRLAVDLNERGKGFGRLLMTEAERIARKHNMTALRIDTNHDNTEMLRLLDELDFKQCGTCQYPNGNEVMERIAYEKPLRTP